jgi:hypothetical protein
MTAKELYNLVSDNAGNDLADAIAILKRESKFCLIGGLAVNCYVDPVYTMDADFVAALKDISKLVDEFKKFRFNVIERRHSLSVVRPGSKVRIQITRDDRYFVFPSRAKNREVLGETLPVACIEDLIQGKTWAFSDPDRKFEKREKDRLDLIRLGMKYQKQLSIMPKEIQNLILAQLVQENPAEEEGIKL